MSDGYIAVRNYSVDVKELKTEKLKDWTTEFDKIVSSNLNTIIDYPTQQFQPKSIIYFPEKS